ncbi:MAG: nucleotidyltransferase [Ignavibacteriales bacterium]|nr:nucleotidyltransferase [Ignavibacteriales bacterium]
MEISKDFEEFFGLLNKYDVRYLVVGGYAVAIHARPRFTNDIDIFIEASEANARKLVAALQEFGFGDVGIAVEDLVRPNQVLQLGYPPFRIDLLTSISGVAFAAAWPRKVSAEYGGQSVYFIGKEDLVVNKREAGRKRDLEDLSDLL